MDEAGWDSLMFSSVCDMCDEVGVSNEGGHSPGNYFQWMDHATVSFFRRVYRRESVSHTLLDAIEKNDADAVAKVLREYIDSFEIGDPFREDMTAEMILNTLAYLNDSEAELLINVAGREEYPVIFRVYTDLDIKEWKYPFHLNKRDFTAACDHFNLDFIDDIKAYFTKQDYDDAYRGFLSSTFE